MKKLLISIICIGLLSSTAWAQDRGIIEKGDKLISVGLGIGNTLHMGSHYSNTLNPITADIEYGLTDDLMEGKASVGVAVFAGLSGSKYSFNAESTRIVDFVVGPTLKFHYDFANRLDTYTGVMLGYDLIFRDKSVTGMAESQMTFRWNIGAKYYLTENFAVMTELGWGGPALSVGLAYNIKNF